LSVLTFAVGATVAASTAVATPAPKPHTPADVPLVPEGVPVDALAALTPAIIGAAAQNIASPGQQAILDTAQRLLNAVSLPPQVRTTLQGVIDFLSSGPSGGGGPGIPQNGPLIAQFLYPSVGQDCIGPGADSVGTALAVPGPAELPPPGPQSGQAGFVFTALGTKGLTHEQNPPMTVQWYNLDTNQGGTQVLTDAAHINPSGPATLSTVANTGAGRVVAVISGSLTTRPAPDQPPITCSFLPTMGFFTVTPPAPVQSASTQQG
jgi:hypothetical protein